MLKQRKEQERTKRDTAEVKQEKKKEEIYNDTMKTTKQERTEIVKARIEQRKSAREMYNIAMKMQEHDSTEVNTTEI